MTQTVVNRLEKVYGREIAVEATKALDFIMSDRCKEGTEHALYETMLNGFKFTDVVSAYRKPAKKRVATQATMERRYQKQLAKLKAKYGIVDMGE